MAADLRMRGERVICLDVCVKRCQSRLEGGGLERDIHALGCE